MDFKTAVSVCHVRSAIYRRSNPKVRYWYNHPKPLEKQVPVEEQAADDWEEYDPREGPYEALA